MLHEFMGATSRRLNTEKGNGKGKKVYFARLTEEQAYTLTNGERILYFTSPKVIKGIQGTDRGWGARLVLDISSSEVYRNLDADLGGEVWKCRSSRISVCA